MIDVLVVDDDEQFGELIVERLVLEGIAAALQAGPFGTINRIRRERPALVILDVNMPAISGQELSKLLREADGLRDIKVLLMSSMDADQLERVRAEVQADAALTKSADRTQLLATVKRLLQRRRTDSKP